MDYNIPDYKPTLKQRSSSKVDSSLEQPALAFDNSNSKLIMFTDEPWAAIIRGWIKTLVIFAAFTALLVALIYSILAASMMFFAPVSGNMVTVARGTFLGGVPAPGTVVIASDSVKASDNPIDRFLVGWTGVPGAEILEIQSGPDDFVTSTETSFSIRGEVEKDIDEPLLDAHREPLILQNEQLQKSYVVKCISGECDKGAYTVVSQELIHGEVKE